MSCQFYSEGAPSVIVAADAAAVGAVVERTTVRHILGNWDVEVIRHGKMLAQIDAHTRDDA